jgi:DNA-binding FrmR family transcriptional regulator
MPMPRQDLLDQIDAIDAAIDRIWRAYLDLAVAHAHSTVSGNDKQIIDKQMKRLQEEITEARWGKR